MKYYIEEETRPLKEAFDEKILQWPDVITRKMMGCPSYMAKGKMFALVVTRGLVLTKLDEQEKQNLTDVHEWEPIEPSRNGLTLKPIPRTLKNSYHSSKLVTGMH